MFKIEYLFEIKPRKSYKDLKDDLYIRDFGDTPFVIIKDNKVTKTVYKIRGINRE